MAKYLETKPGSIEEAIRQVNEKSVSQAQQKAAGAALSAKRGEISPSELVGASKEMYDSMTEKQLQDFQNWPFSIEKKTFGWSDVAIDIRDGGRTFVASGADAGMEVVFYPPSQEFVEV